MTRRTGPPRRMAQKRHLGANVEDPSGKSQTEETARQRAHPSPRAAVRFDVNTTPSSPYHSLSPQCATNHHE